ncbi:MAG: hypothetical protein IJ597_07725 [Synergistaceae bacterium]|nr:hypothetical protein [Synergistaceae bacterium]
MSLSVFIFAKFFKKYFPNAAGIGSESVKIKILSSLRLTSRDVFFVVHCGPDVIAFVLTGSSACLLGKWSYEKWNENNEKRNEK